MPTIPFDFAVVTNLVVTYGMSAIGAVVLLIVGLWAAKLAERGVHRVLSASKRLDPTVVSFLSSLVHYGLLVVVAIAILQVVGIQATSLVAVLGAASLAIGLALQGTLSNMAAGVMLLLFRPFHIGDRIEVGGKSGEVRDLNLFFTELSAADNVQVLIPNGSVWGNPMTNHSAYPNRIVETTVTARNGDADATIDALSRFLTENPKALDEPGPVVRKVAYGDEIQIAVKAWTPASDVSALKYELERFVAERSRRQAAAAVQAAE